MIRAVKKSRRQPWLVISLFVAVYVTLGYDWVVLAFLIFWQVLASVAIVRDVKLLWRTRKGVFVEGQLLRSLEKTDGDGGTIHRSLILFRLPNGGAEKRTIYESKHHPHNRYRLWVDPSNVGNVIVTNNHAAVALNTLLFTAIVLGLCVADYLHIMAILKK